MKSNVKMQIEQLKKEKNAVILAHYYVDGEVQEIADYVGDSYYLAQIATTIPEDVIIFCGVSFMGESAKILNPKKKVVMVDEHADCPMAHMVDLERIKQVRTEYPDVAVVCYVNSTAEIKGESDVCVTSSNALKIVKRLPNENVYFIPDNNLGRYIAKMLPEKNFIFNDGYCHVHKGILRENLEKEKNKFPNAVVLAHPECTEDVLELADYIGSTSQIIDYATSSEKEEFLVCTEIGVFYELKLKNPNKKFYPIMEEQICPNMKRVTLEGVLGALNTLQPEMKLPEGLEVKAGSPLQKMLELAK